MSRSRVAHTPLWRVVVISLALLVIWPAAARADLIDLEHPTAGVHDPIAQMAPVDTECHAGQVDLNKASAQELSSGLHVSKPTAERIRAAGPWLKGADLSSIPGVGPELEAELSDKTCATQPQLPPAHPMACTSASQVDLQSAPTGEIADRLKLPAVTAGDIVAARPLPQDLHQVITPRVRGLSRPKLDKLLDQRAVCVRPAPLLGGGSAYRWATAASGAVAARDGYSLIVPAGRVTDPIGVYVSVTPLPDPEDGGIPTMDATIHGAWDTGNTTVAVRAPWIGIDEERPAVFHDAADGMRLSLGSGTALSGTAGERSVTAQAFSLSEFQFGTTTCQGTAPAPGGPAPLCLQNLIDGSLHKAWLDQALRAGRASNDQLTIRSFCGVLDTGASTAAAGGGLPWGLSCTSDIASRSLHSVRWTNHNDTYGETLWGVASAGVVYWYLTSGGRHDVTVDGDAEGNIFLSLLLDHYHPPGLLFPGQNLKVVKQPSFVSSYIDAVASSADTGTYKGLTILTGSVAEMVGGNLQKADLEAQLIDSCHGGWNSAVDCAKTIGGDFLDNLEEALDGRTKLARKLRFAGAVLKSVDVVGLVGSLGLAVGSNAFSQHTNAEFANVPKRPAVDSKGRDVIDNCLSHDATAWKVDEGCQDRTYGVGSHVPPGSSYIARDPGSHRAVLVTPTGTVKNIASGGVFNCLAATMLVFDIPGQPALTGSTSGNADCSDAGPVAWDFKPARDGGNIPDNVILRERPEDAGSNPLASWLINSQGEIQTIPDGGTYLCLAYANPVIWNVPYGNVPFNVGIQWWRPVGHTPASCG